MCIHLCNYGTEKHQNNRMHGKCRSLQSVEFEHKEAGAKKEATVTKTAYNWLFSYLAPGLNCKWCNPNPEEFLTKSQPDQ